MRIDKHIIDRCDNCGFESCGIIAHCPQCGNTILTSEKLDAKTWRDRKRILVRARVKETLNSRGSIKLMVYLHCENTLCKFKSADNLCTRDEVTLEVPGHYGGEENLTMDCIDFECIDSEEEIIDDKDR